MRFAIVAALDLIAAPLFAEQTGFAKGDQPAVASYSPNAALSFNSAGGPITIKRLGTGSYSVTFAGIAKNMKRLQRAALGRRQGSEQCSLRTWVRGTDNVVISIQCISNTTGANMAGQWSVYAKIIETDSTGFSVVSTEGAGSSDPLAG